MLARVAIRDVATSKGGYSAFVAGTFLFGWLVGFAIVLKLWLLAEAPRWMILSGVGYVTLMLPPAITGFALAWCAGRMAKCPSKYNADEQDKQKKQQPGNVAQQLKL